MPYGQPGWSKPYLEPERETLGPERTAVEERRRLGRPHQPSDAVGVQDGVLSQIHDVADLIARPNDLVPVHDVVADEHVSPLVEVVATPHFQGREDRKPVRIPMADVAQLGEEPA